MKKTYIPLLSPQNTEKNKKGPVEGGIAMQQAKILNGEIRCPICNRKHGEITKKTIIKNLIIQCRGRKSGETHLFEVNYGGLGKNE